MLPKNINDWIVSNPRPINRYGKEYEKIINNLFSSCSVQHVYIFPNSLFVIRV
jgi:hypothetical protein